MRALVTNDDGVHSPGLHALAQVAVHAGLEVVIAAPHEERSGASASLTALQEDGRLIIHESETHVEGVEQVLGVEASPARTAKPWWKKRAAMSSSRERSPPNRCAQPLMSRKSPSAPSSATSGV